MAEMVVVEVDEGKEEEEDPHPEDVPLLTLAQGVAEDVGASLALGAAVDSLLHHANIPSLIINVNRQTSLAYAFRLIAEV